MSEEVSGDDRFCLIIFRAWRGHFKTGRFYKYVASLFCSLNLRGDARERGPDHKRSDGGV